MAKHFAPLVSIVDKYGGKTGGSIAFTSVEVKNTQKYGSSWRESIRLVNERIRQDFQYKSIDVFKHVCVKCDDFNVIFNF